jgi:hypothetical protein
VHNTIHRKRFLYSFGPKKLIEGEDENLINSDKSNLTADKWQVCCDLGHHLAIIKERNSHV